MTPLMFAISLLSAGDGDDRFRREVAPILERSCLRCHQDVRSEGGLSLANADTARKGGEGGPAVVPGKPEESVILEMVEGEPPAMPRQGTPLSKPEVQAIRGWIEAGAHWPEGLILKDRSEGDPGSWWSLRPLQAPLVPPAEDSAWVRNPIDAFIAQGLRTHGLSPGPEADRRTLIRRLTFDLHGLPPTPEAIQAFVDDPDPDAYERLVDRLLVSPRYGERWSRHWLDVVHYGDTHGFDKDKKRPNAWPYRDYVIRALNADVPYDRFLREQVAGDVLDPTNPDAVIATGFVAAGPWDFVGHAELREGTVEKEKTRVLDRDDMVASTIGTFASMTVHCARCHDHKFDPIPQRDYYRLQAVFAGVDRGDRPVPKREGVSTPESVYGLVSHAPRPIHLLKRGEVGQLGDEMSPGALSCVSGLSAGFANSPEEGPRRVALADWLADPGNVLTWRSIVNRVWHFHFGRGIVETPNDFGRNGAKPTHPELLDWLACWFRDSDRSLKALHRLIVTSATYRQTSADRPDCRATDAENRLLWRMNRQRLDAESARDAILATSGTIDLTMGGPGVELFRFKDDHSPIYDHGDVAKAIAPEASRRTVYRFVVRSVANPFLECFDAADPNANTPVRNQTTTALQALALLNDPFVRDRASACSRGIEAGHADTSSRVVALFERLLRRSPTAAERERFARYVEKHGLAHAVRLIWNSNEFLFVD